MRDFCELAIDRTEPFSGCWLWTGDTSSKGGYPRRKFGKRRYQVHTLMWAHFKNNGVLPDEVEVHHTCRRPACINPDHLMILTVDEHYKLHRSDRDAGRKKGR